MRTLPESLFSIPKFPRNAVTLSWIVILVLTTAAFRLVMDNCPPSELSELTSSCWFSRLPWLLRFGMLLENLFHCNRLLELGSYVASAPSNNQYFWWKLKLKLLVGRILNWTELDDAEWRLLLGLFQRGLLQFRHSWYVPPIIWRKQRSSNYAIYSRTLIFTNNSKFKGIDLRSTTLSGDVSD